MADGDQAADLRGVDVVGVGVRAEFVVGAPDRIVVHAVFFFAEHAVRGEDREIGAGGVVGVDQQGRVAGDGGRPVDGAVADAGAGAWVDHEQRAHDPRAFDDQFVVVAVDPVDALGIGRAPIRIDSRADDLAIDESAGRGFSDAEVVEVEVDGVVGIAGDLDEGVFQVAGPSGCGDAWRILLPVARVGILTSVSDPTYLRTLARRSFGVDTKRESFRQARRWDVNLDLRWCTAGPV